MVNENVTHFMREFLIAIIAVIIVIMLLLLLRVAAVAATAIPMTIATTIALMHFRYRTASGIAHFAHRCAGNGSR